MSSLDASATVSLSRDIAEIIDLPPQWRASDPRVYQAWEELMMLAGRQIAARVDYDADMLDRAVGPALEVGSNPAWRVLLMIAQLEARVHHGECAPDEPMLVTAFG